MDEVTAFVLAGGRSTRMGRDKALLVLEGRTLVERAVRLARSVARDVWVVGDPGKFSGLGQVMEDVYRERGPLGGIQVALAGTKSEWNLILAVDMPFLEADFLRWLVQQAQESRATVTVPRSGSRLEPLCAVYRKGFGAVAREELEAGRNKVDRLFGQLEARVIEEEEIVRNGFSSAMFLNVNTADDWERVVRGDFSSGEKPGTGNRERSHGGD